MRPGPGPSCAGSEPSSNGGTAAALTADCDVTDICTAVEDDGVTGQTRLVDKLGERRCALLAGRFGGPPLDFAVLPGPETNKSTDVLFVRRALSTEDVAMVHNAAKHPSTAKRVRHFVVPPYSARLEWPLRALAKPVFERLLALAEWADGLLWKGLPPLVYPEAEYIVYEAPPDASVGPHIDEDSAVTAVVMLSHAADFAGGENGFGGNGTVARHVRMDLGDAIFFRGECLEHWVTPVSVGRRVIVQMELCRR